MKFALLVLIIESVTPYMPVGAVQEVTHGMDVSFKYHHERAVYDSLEECTLAAEAWVQYRTDVLVARCGPEGQEYQRS